MQLYLLEFTYAVEDHKRVKVWLSEANLSGVVISVGRYDHEMFVVLASECSMREDHQTLSLQPAIASCQTKQRMLYRVTTSAEPEDVFRTFPLAEGDEWYWSSERTCYLATQLPRLRQAQITWLATCSHITSWEHIFDLRKSPL